ncbi:MAG: hypothetical protein ACI4L1_02335 [Christensenellales bacterium]
MEKKKISDKKTLKEKNQKYKEEFLNNIKQIKEDFANAKAERQAKNAENKALKEEKQRAKTEENLRKNVELTNKVEKDLRPQYPDPKEEEPFYDIFKLIESYGNIMKEQKEAAGYKTKAELEEEKLKKYLEQQENEITSL